MGGEKERRQEEGRKGRLVNWKMRGKEERKEKKTKVN